MDVNRIIPINDKIRPALEEFLAYPEYQDLFKQFSRVVGCTSDNKQEILNSLFSPDDSGEIYFSVEGLYDLFVEFQLMKQLMDKPLYKDLLSQYPEAIRNIREVAKKAARGEDLTSDDLDKIFDTDAYDRERAPTSVSEN